jgi:choline dehydrogenase-like flavoprotein
MPELEGADEYDYIVVGSGAGGGPLAANLVRAGYQVLLLEAGGDAESDTYRVPAFHLKASEDPEMSWDFFVRHYESEDRQRLDPKYTAEKGGVLYPRAGVLGGCTAHNAMISVYPHDDDWNQIAETTGDASWRADRMRALFQRLENCRYRAVDRWMNLFGYNPSRHGFGGWLSTEAAVPGEVFGDEELVETICSSVVAAMGSAGDKATWLREVVRSLGDPNDGHFVKDSAEGVCFTPLATQKHARTGSRAYLRATAQSHPDKLTIELHALATRILLDADRAARGVEYSKSTGKQIYRAAKAPTEEPAEKRVALARREVIVSGGAFNTPQLLMLSGIGPPDELEEHGIKVLVRLPGVGRNLQDRYEVGVVSRLKKDWDVLRGSSYSTEDPQFYEWQERRAGLYTSNGAVLAVIRKSSPTLVLPDLFLMAIIGDFRGYYPGYSRGVMSRHNYLTWCILKAHTKNRAGTVTLRSNEARDMPAVNFHYFEEGDDARGEDLDAVVNGIEIARSLTKGMSHLIEAEEAPGEERQSREALRQFVRDHAWGHHASCTCKIGRSDDPMAVVDGDFRVHGTRRLRVVDASVFPKIPGFFIAVAVYMISEKATDSILRDAQTERSAKH